MWLLIFFLNQANLIESAKVMIKKNVGDGLRETEVYHLKKLVQKGQIQST